MAEPIVLTLRIDGVESEIKSVDDLRASVSKLESTLESAELGSDAFKRAAKELKAARGELYQFERQLETLQDPVKASEKWVKYGEGVAGAFAAAQGAAAIFGAESENVQKMVVKAQGAVSIAMGARMLAESQLITMLAGTKAAQLALNAVERIRIATTLASAAATRVLQAAMAAVGIGLLTTAVAALVTNWNTLVDGFKTLASKARDLIPGLDKVVGFLGRMRDLAVGVGQAMGVVASDSEQAAKKMAESAMETLETEQKAYDKRLELAKAHGEDTTAMEKEWLQRRANLLSMAAAGEDEAADAAYQDALHNLDVFHATVERTEREHQQNLFEQRRAAEEKERQERQREFEERMAAEDKALTDRIKRAGDEAKRKAERLKAEREKAAEEKAAHDEYMSDIDAAAAEAQAKDHEDTEEENAAFDALMVQQVKDREEAILAYEAYAAEARANLQQALFGSLSTLVNSMDQNSERTQRIQKTLALAEIAFNAGKSISAVVASATAAAAALGPGAPFAIGPYIAQGLAVVLPSIASAYAALKKAPGGGGGGSAPTATGASASVPQFQAPDISGGEGNASTDDEEFGTGGSGRMGAPTRAFVLSGDVASDMEARQRVKDLAGL